MSAEEERAVREQLERLQEEEEEDAKRFLELTEGLAVERSEHKATIEAKDRKVHRLRTQLETLALKTQEVKTSGSNHIFFSFADALSSKSPLSFQYNVSMAGTTVIRATNVL